MSRNPCFPPHSAFTALVLTLLTPLPATAQNKSVDTLRQKSTTAVSPVDSLREKGISVPPAMRDDLEIIGRHADAVSRQLSGRTPEPAAETTAEAAPAPVPVDGSLPRRAAGPRRLDNLVDPFEVSPQLRDNRRSPGAFAGLPSASRLDVQRQIQVKAVLVSARGKGAQLLVRGQTVLVKDGDLVDFGDLGTYAVHVDTKDGVTLTNPGMPQGSRITLR